MNKMWRTVPLLPAYQFTSRAEQSRWLLPHGSLYSTKISKKPEHVQHSRPGCELNCCMAWDTVLLLESQPAAIYEIRDALSFARWALRVPLQVFEIGFAFPCFSVLLHVTVVLLQRSPQNLRQLVNSLNAVGFFFSPSMQWRKASQGFSLRAP